MTDAWEELERLAKAATHSEWVHGEGATINIPQAGTLFVSFRGNGTVADAAFIAAANPATVLSLIAAARANPPVDEVAHPPALGEWRDALIGLQIEARPLHKHYANICEITDDGADAILAALPPVSKE
jgi:hypothetical protein